VKKPQPTGHNPILLGLAGLVTGVVVLVILQSLPIATGAAAATVVALLVLKHLALFLAVSSPAAALWNTMREKLPARCPLAPRRRRDSDDGEPGDNGPNRDA